MRVTDKFVFFFSKDDVFSNWYIAPFTDSRWPGIVFRCVEQYMMFRKALLFSDIATAEDIMSLQRIRKNEKEQAYYKRLGREVKGYDQDTWVDNREAIVKRGMMLKYRSTPELYQTLMQYQSKTFVEASPYDAIYGVKMGMWDDDILDPENWKGDNLLGLWHNDLMVYFYHLPDIS